MEKLLNWYDGGNRELPWRGAKDPYKIWISEIMLQQTRAETVIGYYNAFIDEWPDVHALAAADLNSVLKRWEGLGYYSRVRHLHACARSVVNDYQGVFPETAAGLRQLPGIGDYTSAMIASIAYDEPAPAIDGNQIRVLSRLFHMDKPARSREGMTALRVHAEGILDRDRPGDFNQALMDLGRLMCKPKSVNCDECPLRSACESAKLGDALSLPILPLRQKQRIERQGVAVVVCEGKVLITKQPDSGILRGLSVLPHYIDAHNMEAVAEILAEIGIDAQPTGDICQYNHVFTHLIWQQVGYGFRAKATIDVPNCRWVDEEKLLALTIPAAHWAFRDMAIQMIDKY